MSHVVTAVYEDGVFKPTEPLDLAPHTTVQLTVEPVPAWEASRAERLAALDTFLRQARPVEPPEPHLSRDALHERR
jgi:predicted DNA-binding antitoxin AbrB/MazE fold protein